MKETAEIPGVDKKEVEFQKMGDLENIAWNFHPMGFGFLVLEIPMGGCNTILCNFQG